MFEGAGTSDSKSRAPPEFVLPKPETFLESLEPLARLSTACMVMVRLHPEGMPEKESRPVPRARDEMETKKAFKAFKYRAEVRWTSGRRGETSAAGLPTQAISSPPEFKGEPGLWTPETLFVSSLNACTMLTFLAYAEHRGLAFSSYECSAEGTLANVEGKYRFTEIILAPKVAVNSEAEVERAHEILSDAHRDCFISNSITTAVKLQPDIHVEDPERSRRVASGRL